jgi:P-type Ca2+ transporter type 2C
VPWGAFIRKIPDHWVAACIPNIKIRIPMPWHKKKPAKPEGGDLEATPVDSRDPKNVKANITDSTDDDISFEAPLRILTSLRGERARKHIRRGFREYMHDQKVKVKEKTKEKTKGV